MQRIQEGFKMVMEPGGTGYYVIDPTLKPAGKTGTSQNFIDTNNDKRIDTETITTSFVAYAPYDNPEVTFTVITPNVSDMTSYSYISLITQKIAKEVSNAYFSLK